MTRHLRLKWAALTAILIFFGGCAAKETTGAKADKEPWVVRVESPLDTIQVTPEKPAQTTSTTEETSTQTANTMILESPTVTESAGTMTASREPVPSPTATAPAATPNPQSFIPGWRVQIDAYQSITTAEAAAAKARQRFTEAVYVEYEAPYYKVRVGDFLSKDDARHMANRAKAENYTKAWVVEDLVMRPER
ncbi:MAG TPA: SPOR domain-containing protein [Candidatus Eisenbacteria bacterium]|nr:SPOR domain-containing protein [Candidatus Eisenbacteria bacterium]